MNVVRNDTELKERRRELRRNQTEAEVAFWQQVRNRQFHGLKFFRQYSVGSYILDFYCPTLKLGVELDGGQHNCPEGREKDAVRSGFLRTQGVMVVRFWNHDVLQNMSGVLEQLAVSARVTPPSLPLTQGEEQNR